jgi:hypothetical protein
MKKAIFRYIRIGLHGESPDFKPYTTFDAHFIVKRNMLRCYFYVIYLLRCQYLRLYRMFQKALHNFERIYKFMQRTYTRFWTVIMLQNTQSFTSDSYGYRGRTAPIEWPPHSPDGTPLDFLWGFVKDWVFVPYLPANVAELRTRITAAVAEVTPEVLCCRDPRCWWVMNYTGRAVA